MCKSMTKFRAKFVPFFADKQVALYFRVWKAWQARQPTEIRYNNKPTERPNQILNEHSFCRTAKKLARVAWLRAPKLPCHIIEFRPEQVSPNSHWGNRLKIAVAARVAPHERRLLYIIWHGFSCHWFHLNVRRRTRRFTNFDSFFARDERQFVAWMPGCFGSIE